MLATLIVLSLFNTNVPVLLGVSTRSSPAFRVLITLVENVMLPNWFAVTTLFPLIEILGAVNVLLAAQESVVPL